MFQAQQFSQLRKLSLNDTQWQYFTMQHVCEQINVGIW